jgi:putative lipoic acid-binding regulatory protein
MNAETPPESALQFPCDFPIKAMGLARDDLEFTVVEIVRRHAPDLGEGAVSCRASTNGKYLSVTVTVRATSKQQLDAIYLDLTACEQVLMAL